MKSICFKNTEKFVLISEIFKSQIKNYVMLIFLKYAELKHIILSYIGAGDVKCTSEADIGGTINWEDSYNKFYIYGCYRLDDNELAND